MQSPQRVTFSCSLPPAKVRALSPVTRARPSDDTPRVHVPHVSLTSLRRKRPTVNDVFAAIRTIVNDDERLERGIAPAFETHNEEQLAVFGLGGKNVRHCVSHPLTLWRRRAD